MLGAVAASELAGKSESGIINGGGALHRFLALVNRALISVARLAPVGLCCPLTCTTPQLTREGGPRCMDVSCLW